jgi:hypothetical protein
MAAPNPTITPSSDPSRLIALNRKNTLFADSDGSTKHWATIASLIEIYTLDDVDPLAYLDAFDAGYAQRSLMEITPLRPTEFFTVPAPERHQKADRSALRPVASQMKREERQRFIAITNQASH